MTITKQNIARKIQYTNVRADATRDEIIQHCRDAAACEFQAVMLQPCWIRLAQGVLSGSNVRVASAVSYPMGGETWQMKVALVRQVIDLGVDEFDFQPNIGYLKSGMLEEFEREIRAIVRVADGRIVKLMSEFGFLTKEEKKLCITLAEQAGVSFIKNSSGVGPGGSAATIKDIRFIKSHISGRTKIKASGRIKGFKQAVSLINAGADLLGTSSALAILGETVENSNEY